jgi:succinate dehydrogenase flavin-adding protein (antitoxin of CptAB toxin-antitoxin module)
MRRYNKNLRILQKKEFSKLEGQDIDIDELIDGESEKAKTHREQILSKMKKPQDSFFHEAK